MKQILSIISIIVFGLQVKAQSSIEAVLKSVEENNTTLAAYRKSADAEKLGNKTRNTIENPEIGFNYLWGNPSVLGNRTDISITQSFDFPTAYAYKNQIADLKNEQAELEYKKQRIDLMYSARVLCIKLIYYNTLNVELGKQYANAQKIASAYQTMFDAGEVSVLEFNKAQVEGLNLEKQLKSIEIERNSLLAELAALNGGKVINFKNHEFPLQVVPSDFEHWFQRAEAKNPILQWLAQELAISSKTVQLKKAMSLPKISGGYMSEKVVGEQFQGVSIGLSIPLWENKNTVKYAKAKTQAVESMEADAKLQFYNTMKLTHAKVVAIQQNVTEYRTLFEKYSSYELLYTAFSKGEFSLTEYLTECSIYNESVQQILQLEQELYLNLAELKKFE